MTARTRGEWLAEAAELVARLRVDVDVLTQIVHVSVHLPDPHTRGAELHAATTLQVRARQLQTVARQLADFASREPAGGGGPLPAALAGAIRTRAHESVTDDLRAYRRGDG